MRIAIIGAGPAGLSTAYNAAKDGHDVIVYEADPFEKVPSKPCGEAIPADALRYTPFTERSDFILNNIRSVMFYWEGEFVREMRDFPLANGYIIDKRAFLVALMEAAESEGARIFFNKRILYKDLPKLDNFDMIVDASGIGVLGRYFLDYKNYKTIPVLQAYARGESVPPDTIVFWGLERGYAWVFPRGDLYNIGVGGINYSSQFLRETLDKVLEKFELQLVTNIRGSYVSAGGPLKKLVKGKIRVVGESAGMVMPLTGEGIRYALIGGTMVYKENYEELFDNTIRPRLEKGALLLKIVLRIPNKGRLAKKASDELLYRFFEGTFSIKDAFKTLVKYISLK